MGLAIVVFTLIIMLPAIAEAQCSMCTKTAQQLGEKPAQGLNSNTLFDAYSFCYYGRYRI